MPRPLTTALLVATLLGATPVARPAVAAAQAAPTAVVVVRRAPGDSTTFDAAALA